MTDFLRLLLTPTDLARIDAASIVVTETPFRPVPASAADPRPQSLRLQFRITNPAAGAPQLRMIFPGEVCFQPVAPTGAQQMPAAANITFTGQDVDAVAFANWPGRGVLRVQANATKITKALTKDNKMAGIGVPPLIAWFDPVVITREFLNDAVLNGMTRRKIVITNPPNPDQAFEGTTIGWNTHAVERFYQGLYRPLLDINKATPLNRNLDDVIRFPMPEVPMTATGDVDIRITLGWPRSASEIAEFVIPNPLYLPELHPGHPNVETLPTRVFFQQHRTQIIGAPAGNAVVDAIIGGNTFAQTAKANLNACGFGNLGPADNSFDRRAHWAVREFQIYSKMQNVATEPAVAVGEYANRLQQAANPMLYTGPINGFLNAATRERLELWVDPGQRLRCPVVVTARTSASGFATAATGGDNLWAHNDLADETPRVFVRDLSSYYANLTPIDACDVSVNGNRFIVLGYFESDGQGGPEMGASHSWSNMGVDAVRLTGVTQEVIFGAEGNGAMRSTYLTVIPTIEEETLSRFDVVNAWDNNATISIPLFHYTLHSGELGGLLSYMDDREPETFATAISFFGMKPGKLWANIHHEQAKRTSPMQHIREAGGTWANVPGNQTDENYLKNWHWFYRMVMANRLNDNWKLRAYEYARIRIQDLLGVAMTHKPKGHPAIPPVAAGGAAAMLGQVFTSEAAIAILLRWHVNRSAHIAGGGVAPHAAEGLWDVMRRAQVPAQNGGHNLVWNKNVATWGNNHEAALIEAIIGQVATFDTNLSERLVEIRDTAPVVGHNLSRDRGSLHFHAP